MVGLDPVQDSGFCMADGPVREPGLLGFVCSLEDEHDGDHKAIDTRTGVVYDSWPNERKTRHA